MSDQDKEPTQGQIRETVLKQFNACNDAFALLIESGIREDVLFNAMLNHISKRMVSEGTTQDFEDMSEKIVYALGQYFLDNLHRRYDDVNESGVKGITSLEDVPEMDAFTRALFESYY